MTLLIFLYPDYKLYNITIINNNNNNICNYFIQPYLSIHCPITVCTIMFYALYDIFIDIFSNHRSQYTILQIYNLTTNYLPITEKQQYEKEKMDLYCTKLLTSNTSNQTSLQYFFFFKMQWIQEILNMNILEHHPEYMCLLFKTIIHNFVSLTQWDNTIISFFVNKEYNDSTFGNTIVINSKPKTTLNTQQDTAINLISEYVFPILNSPIQDAILRWEIKCVIAQYFGASEARSQAIGKFILNTRHVWRNCVSSSENCYNWHFMISSRIIDQFPCLDLNGMYAWSKSDKLRLLEKYNSTKHIVNNYCGDQILNECIHLQLHEIMVNDSLLIHRLITYIDTNLSMKMLVTRIRRICRLIQIR